MKILIYSSTFYPNVGGMETFAAGLAEELQAQGHRVILLTLTELKNQIEPFSFPIYRNPSLLSTYKLAQWCDVFVQNCISLKNSWIYGLFRKKIVAIHHTWYRRIDGSKGWQDELKLLICSKIKNIAVSRAIADSIPAPIQVIPNFYDDQMFKNNSKLTRSKDLVFLGRLVSDKGPDILLQALSQLHARKIYPTVSLVGKGPEEKKLRAMIQSLSLEFQVEMVGPQTRDALVNTLNTHKILVVPSRWEEPFGIVALEGIACGCVVVGSEGGGLKEAIGACGVTFPNGDVNFLTGILENLLTNPSVLTHYLQFAELHLAMHSRKKIALEYTSAFQQISQKCMQCSA